jgi:hypothetical protein
MPSFPVCRSTTYASIFNVNTESYSGYREMIENDLDAVSIVVPTTLHMHACQRPWLSSFAARSTLRWYPVTWSKG